MSCSVLVGGNVLIANKEIGKKIKSKKDIENYIIQLSDTIS